ncbi:MAG: hypothetical protein K0S16_137 [Moraxellaceae bacterium]|jgi:hypothetical protein|nr:hypothetical protein [Moraxellaceae bacterium]
MLIAGLAAWAGLLLFFHATTGWVPILDSANLAFHEAGHPLFGLLHAGLAVYGGTLMQLLMPAACAFKAWRQEKHGMFYFCVIWIAENLLNIARYLADARAHGLPLVGGLDPEYSHDWTEILAKWGLLEQELALAFTVRMLAVALMAWALFAAWRTQRTQCLVVEDV